MLQYFPYCPWLQDCVPTLAFSSTSFIQWIDLCTEYESTNIFGRRFSYSFNVLADTRPIVPHHFTFYSNPGQTIISWPNRGISNRTERKCRKCRNQSPYLYRSQLVNYTTTGSLHRCSPDTRRKDHMFFIILAQVRRDVHFSLSMAWPVVSCGAFSWV